MPRKSQFSVGDIVTAAVELVREKGWSGLSAGAVADRLGASTMPIYSHFKNMHTLQDAVVKEGWLLLMRYEAKRYSGDIWIDQAIGYVQFAKQERQLFMCMFDGRNLALHREMLKAHWRHLSKLVEGYPDFEGLGEEVCMRIRYSRAMLSHGVATSVSMGYGEILDSDEVIATYLTGASRALLNGYQQASPLNGEDSVRFKEKMKRIK